MPIIYKLSGRVVKRDEFISHETMADTDFSHGSMPSVIMRDTSWGSENGGRGRYISQMADKPNDPKAYYKSQSEVAESCKRRGFSYELD
jgi:hypothetical protein